jgi:hypothetical protein
VRLDSRADLLWTAVRGGNPATWTLVQAAAGGDVWRRGERRAVLDAQGGAARAEELAGGAWRPLAGDAGAALLAEARAATGGLAPLRAPASPARVPPGDWPAGW